MKKGKYIDIYVMMACLSRKRQNFKLQNIDELLNKACEGCKEKCNEDAPKRKELQNEGLSFISKNFESIKTEMKKIVICIASLIVTASFNNLKAQEIKAETSREFMHVTTVESVLAGGLGRSKMIITNPDGEQKESDLENLFSVVGINFKNIKGNEDKLVRTLKSYTDKGWEIEHVTSLTLSQNDSGAGGIFMTRYLLSKDENKVYKGE